MTTSMLHDIMTQYCAWREIIQPSKSESVLIETLWLKKSWHRNPINQFWSLFFWLWKNTAFFCNWSRHASFLFMYSATRIQLDVDLWNFLIILAEISSSKLFLQISKSQLFFPIWIIIISMHLIWETYSYKLKLLE